MKLYLKLYLKFVVVNGFQWIYTDKEKGQKLDISITSGLLWTCLDYQMVPEVGIEPTLSRGKGDFESPASTCFTTPALIVYMLFKRSFR